MKNNKLTYYLLIPAVMIIWGIIIYKIVVRNDDRKVSETRINAPKKGKAVNENEIYQLINNYSDPFFGEHPQLNEVSSSDRQEVVKPKVEKKWPVIRFDGYILNGNKIKCHLTVSGEDKILQVNEKVIEDYIVSAITPDSVKINCEGNSRWLKK